MTMGSERTLMTKVWLAAVAVAVPMCACGLAAAATAQPSQRVLTQAVNQYLADHGDLCVGKFTWPREVTPADDESHSNDAVQLPVLERLGLVESTEVPAAPGAAPTPGPVRRYSLTAKGQQFYLQKKRTTLGGHDQAVEHDGDLCVAHLTLDKVVKWAPPEPFRGHVETLVKYTYKIKSAAWMTDPEARKVFPVVDRIIHGAGTLEMTATVQQQGDKWLPVMPGQ
jgi:hypothetical protein